MSYFQNLNPRVVAHVANLRHEASDRPVSTGDVRIILTGRQYLKYYSARHHNVEYMLFWPARQTNRSEGAGDSVKPKPEPNKNISNNNKLNEGDADNGQEVEI